MIKVRIFTAVAAILVVTAFSCAARPLPTASTDIVPREDWSYDAMIHLAGRGLVPDATANRFSGHWLYSREEMAGFVARTIDKTPDSAPEADKALLGKLAAEFRSELIVLRAESSLTKAEPWSAIKAVVPAGFLDGRLVNSGSDTDPVGIYHVTGLGSVGRTVTVGMTLDNERWRFDGHEFSRLEKYFIRGKTPSVEWEFGRDILSWGPDYSGSMILSDNSPGFVMGKIGKDFYFGKRIGYVKVTQFASSWEDHDLAPSIRYFLYGRRFEKRFSDRFHLGISETAKTTDIHPNLLIAVLPSFYLYQRIYKFDVDTEFNDLVSVDMWYRFSRGFQGYTDLLVDDIQAPTFLHSGESWHLPRKIGLLAGGYWPDLLGDGTTRLRTELIYADPGTFQASRPEFPGLAYTHDGDFIGTPVGSNSEAAFLRIDRRIAEHWDGSLEYLTRRPKSSTGPNPFDTSRLSLYISRDLTPRSTIWLRYDRLRLPEKENRLQLAGSWAF